jgi:predicted nucleic-acid-binding protein
MKRRSLNFEGDRVAVDTNVLVRYFTWDDEQQGQDAARVIESAGTIVVSTIVLCELVWVLKRAYRYTDQPISNILQRLLQTNNIELDRLAAEAGIAMLRKKGGFADGVIRLESRRSKCKRLVTFDQNFARICGAAEVELLARQ